jgi:hypothetical protein
VSRPSWRRPSRDTFTRSIKVKNTLGGTAGSDSPLADPAAIGLDGEGRVAGGKPFLELLDEMGVSPRTTLSFPPSARNAADERFSS